MDILLAGIIIAVAGWRSRRLSHYWQAALVIISVSLLSILLYSSHGYSLTNCGKLYNPDIGCMAAQPDWIVPAGLGLGAALFILSVAILIVSSRHKTAD